MNSKTKEIEVVKSKIVKSHQLATEMSTKIKSDGEYKEASEMLVNIKKLGKLVTQEKKKQLDPANATVKAIREFWKPLEDQYKEGESILKTAVLSYKQKIDARNSRKDETISKNVESGKISFEKGVEKIDDIHSAPATHEGIQSRMIKKVRFTQIAELQDSDVISLARIGYLKLDEVAMRRDALAGKIIIGAEVYEEESLAV